MDCDASLDPQDLPLVADRPGDLVLGARRGAQSLHARLANRALAFELRRRTGLRLTDLGPMRAARREPLLALGIRDRRFGWPLEMVLRAAAAGWTITEVEVPYRPARGPLEGDGHGARHRARGAGHGGGPAMTALIVIAKAPVAGRVKTRLTPPFTPAQAAGLAAAALVDTLAAGTCARRAQRRVLVLDGEPGTWVPDGFEVLPQRGDGLAERLAAAFDDVGGPAFLVGMDTPQVTPALLDAGLAALDRADAVFGAALDGGYWSIGLRRPDPEVFRGVPMSESDTGARQRARLAELGLRTEVLPPLCDVDTAADARVVAAAAPRSRFAAMLEEVAA